jgi:hypothetical protein
MVAVRFVSGQEIVLMKVAIIGCTASEIMSACHVTISSLAKEGHKIYAIITPVEASKSSLSSASEITTDQKSIAGIGFAHAFVIEAFDYSAITQANADAVNVHIKDVKPSLVIMPSWKSPNYLRRILARVSLIACRGIGTIWMYELDSSRNKDFVPTVIFEAAVVPASILRANNIVETTTSSIVQDGIDTKKNAFADNDSLLENKYSKTISSEVLKEKFESHRTLLLEEDGLF